LNTLSRVVELVIVDSYTVLQSVIRQTVWRRCGGLPLRLWCMIKEEMIWLFLL